MRSLAEMHSCLGPMVWNCHTDDDNHGRFNEAARAGESNLCGLQIDAVVRPVQPIEMADTPDMQALVAREAEIAKKYDTAWSDYYRHRDAARYRRELAEIEKQAEVQP